MTQRHFLPRLCPRGCATGGLRATGPKAPRTGQAWRKTGDRAEPGKPGKAPGIPAGRGKAAQTRAESRAWEETRSQPLGH